MDIGRKTVKIENVPEAYAKEAEKSLEQLAREVVAKKIPGIRKSFFRTAQECYMLKHQEPCRRIDYRFIRTYVAQNEIGGYEFKIEMGIETEPCICPQA